MGAGRSLKLLTLFLLGPNTLNAIQNFKSNFVKDPVSNQVSEFGSDSNQDKILLLHEELRLNTGRLGVAFFFFESHAEAFDSLRAIPKLII